MNVPQTITTFNNMLGYNYFEYNYRGLPHAHLVYREHNEQPPQPDQL